MQAFTLDHASSIPVKVQLMAQVTYQISAGLLRPGDQLPPLRDLAAGLGIHLNTVVRALDELAEAGYVVSHQGRGVFVADDPPAPPQGAALRSLLAGVLQSGRDWGLSPEALGLAMLAHGSLARPPGAAPHRLLLVGGSRTWLRRVKGDLEALLPATVIPALSDEVEERVRAADFRVAACSLFHQAEVRRWLPGARTVLLASADEQTAFSRLASQPQGTPVTISAPDWVETARIRRSLELAGLTGLVFTLDRSGSGARIAAGSTVLGEPVAVPGPALADLRSALEAPRTEAAVHVRSAWV